MKQNPVQQFISECGRAKIFVENEMPIGIFHDFLMQLKGLMVERMVTAHQEQVQQAQAALDLPPHESEVSAMPDQPSCATQDCSKGE